MTRALIATDGSDLSIRAAQRARQLLGDDCQYTILYVMPFPAVAPPDVAATGFGVAAPYTGDLATGQQEEAFENAAEEAIRRTVEVIGSDAERRIEQGDAGPVICEVAAEGRFDVVALGSHGTGFVQRLLLGSVSHHVLHHATCPVLVTREADDT